MTSDQPHKAPSEGELEIKIYYEDTDSLGVVYYANYLKFFERGRTELVEKTGWAVQRWNQEGYNFAVYKLTVTFVAPARLGDVCTVRTRIVGGTAYRCRMEQQILRGDDVITEAEVTLVCLDDKLELQEVPAPLVLW